METAALTNHDYSDFGSFNPADFGVSDTVAELALANIRSGTAVGIAVSGKLASGKDTIAPAVLDVMGAAPVDHLFFAQPLKDELNTVIDIARIRSGFDAVSIVAEVLGIGLDQAGTLLDSLWPDLAEDRSLNAKSRTPGVRQALQYLGTDVRRKQDDDWWVKRSMGRVLESVAQGNNVMLTDCRFPNEVDGSRSVGLFTVRLCVTEDTQAARLFERDGLLPDPDLAAHPSETALDGFQRFHCAVDNNGTVADTVPVVCAEFAQHLDAVAQH